MAQEGAIPVTHLNFLHDADDFQFAVIGDRTGGEREGVFNAAVELLNILRPEFVISVGDNIEGYTHDRTKLITEWERCQTEIGNLSMPFFMTPGNHDLNNEAQRSVWQERFGSTYYYFIYRNVLFLVLSSEDPSHLADPEFEKDIEKYNKLKNMDPPAAEKMLKEFMASDKLKQYGLPANFSNDQVAFVEKTLLENTDVNWTFVILHQPAWENPSENFLKIENSLKENERNFTVIAGHMHYYKHVKRFGRDYITMGPAGGSWHTDGPGNVDHVTWITMTSEGPLICNIKLNGVFDLTGLEKP